MDVIGLDRVVLATPHLEETAEEFEALLGLSFGEVLEPTTSTESGNQEVANLLSSAGVELVTPRDDNGEVHRFLEANGAGLYALSLRVTDLEEAKDHLAERGLEPVGQFEANDFSEVFYHPRHFDGAMVILAEYHAPHPAETASL